jgi:hypothetical protein
MKPQVAFNREYLVRLLTSDAAQGGFKFKPGAKLTVVHKRFVQGHYDEPGEWVENEVEEVVLKEVKED